MAFENICTPKLMEVSRGVRGQVELPSGHRFMARCNQAVRPIFSEPLALTEQSSECAGSAIERARHEHSISLSRLADKQRKLEVFQNKVNARLRAVKRATKQDYHTHTLYLQQADNTLLNDADNRKSVLINSTNIAILPAKPRPESSLANTQKELASCTRYARSKLAGDKDVLSGIVILPQADEYNSDDEDIEEEVVEKENIEKTISLKSLVRVENLVKGTEEATRKHRIVESRKAYGLFERERSKEVKKATEHKQRVERLRRETEILRLQKESEVNEAIENYIESPRAIDIEERVHKAIKRNKSLTTDTDKIISRLRSRVSNMPSPPPSMCSCDQNIINTGPGLCAQNCTFYNNSKSFARAFSSLLNCYQ